jgi:hypothetical protein
LTTPSEKELSESVKRSQRLTSRLASVLMEDVSLGFHSVNDYAAQQKRCVKVDTV